MALGVVSLLTDLSSEMIYPLLPVFLVSVLGTGAVALGVIEGVAESTSALVKVASGRLADRLRRRKPLVLGGYGISGLARPLIGLAGAWPVVVMLRFSDRLGKGIRTSPRDALIADVTEPSRRGAAYGLHRAMDHAGAVLGPLVAAALLALPFMDLRRVFLLSIVPAVAVMLVLVLAVQEPEHAAHAPDSKPGPATGLAELGPEYRRLLGAVALFALGNSTDAFLLLRFVDLGVGAAAVAVLWSLHHVVKMAATWVGGRLSDRQGRKPLVLAGWAVYVAVYIGFASFESTPFLIGLFLAYGVYYGLTEPVERAWVAELAPEQQRGAAFGWYHGVVGVTALPASLLFGFLYLNVGAAAAFGTGSGLAVLGALLLTRLPSRATS